MRSGDEEEDPIVNVIAPTSTSHTLVLSETRPATEEISPPQRDIGNLTPPGSPRAPSPKRARVEPVEGSNLLTRSSSTPSLDDVSALTTHFYCCRTFFFLVFLSLLFSLSL
jgi:hypothetical protein